MKTKNLLQAVLLLTLAAVNSLNGQTPQPPDCVVNFTSATMAVNTPVGASATFDNRSVACQTWTVDYQGTISAGTVSLTLQSATGATVAGTFGTYTGTTVTGTNPLTSNTGAVSTFANGTVAVPWIRVLLNTAGITGTVNGVLYGYKTGYPGSGGSAGPTSNVNVQQVGGTTTVTGGVAGTLGVGGPTATGSPLAARPVLMGGSDGTNVRNLSTDATGKLNVNAAITPSGTQNVQGTQADGAVTTANPVLIGGFDGTNTQNIITDTSGRTVAVGAAASGATNAGNPVKAGGVFNTTQPTVTNGQAVDLQATARGAEIVATGTDTFHVTVDSTPAVSNQSVNLAQVGATAVVTGGVNGSQGVGGLAANAAAVAGNPLLMGGSDGTNARNISVNASGQQLIVAAPDTTSTVAATGCYLVSTASTNATNCKASAGNVYGYRVVNTTAVVYYLRMYNASGTPTCSSATGFIESIPIPASSSSTGAGIVQISNIPIQYGTGIAFCFTGGSSSTDNTNAAVGVFGAIIFK